MSEKNQNKLNDETLENVSGGQDGYRGAADYGDIIYRSDMVELVCPKCGGGLGVLIPGNSTHYTSLTCTCPHCNEVVTVPA